MEDVEAETTGDGKPFGQVAKRLGYCSQEDVQSALDQQRKLQVEEDTEKLIGMIMLDQGILTTDQLISVLRVLEHKHKKDISKTV